MVESRGQGEPVVFLHGIGGNRHNWGAQLSEFGARYRALALDLRGYGESDDFDGELIFEDFVEDVAKVAIALELPPLHLVGLSMGGLVAQAFYAAHPERVASLTLVACSPGSAPVFPGERRASFAEARLKPLEQGGSVETLAGSLAPSLVSPQAPPEIVAAVRDSLLRLRVPNYLRTLRARLAIEPFLDLAAIDVPVLVMAGSADRLAPPSQMQDIARRIRGSRFVLVEHAGHLLNLERAAQFNRALEDFLASVGATAGAKDRAEAGGRDRRPFSE